MHRELRASKRLRRLMLVGALVFSGVAAFAGDSSEPSGTARYLFVGFFGFVAALSALLLVNSSRFRLTVEENWIQSKDLFGTQRICFDSVRRAKWLGSGDTNQLWLYDGDKSLVIGFGELEGDDRLELITWLRQRLPAAVQEGWDLYCLRVALPMQKSAMGIEEPLAPGQVVVTRRSFDRLVITGFLVALTPVMFTIVGLAGWKTAVWQPLFVGLIPLPVLLLLRFTVPKEGTRAYRLSASIDWREFPARTFVRGSAATALSWLLAWQIWGAWPATIVALVVWGVALITGSYRIGKRQMAAQQLASQGADAEWRSLRVGNGNTSAAAAPHQG